MTSRQVKSFIHAASNDCFTGLYKLYNTQHCLPPNAKALSTEKESISFDTCTTITSVSTSSWKSSLSITTPDNLISWLRISFISRTIQIVNHTVSHNRAYCNMKWCIYIVTQYIISYRFALFLTAQHHIMDDFGCRAATYRTLYNLHLINPPPL